MTINADFDLPNEEVISIISNASETISEVAKRYAVESAKSRHEKKKQLAMANLEASARCMAHNRLKAEEEGKDEDLVKAKEEFEKFKLELLGDKKKKIEGGFIPLKYQIESVEIELSGIKRVVPNLVKRKLMGKITQDQESALLAYNKRANVLEKKLAELKAKKE